MTASDDPFSVFGEILDGSTSLDADFQRYAIYLNKGEEGEASGWHAPADGWWIWPACGTPGCCPPDGPFETEEDAMKKL